MYYVLSYDVPQDEDGGYFDVEDGLELDGIESWSLGRRLDAAPTEPISVDIVPVDGYTGLPSEMYDGNLCLMAARLVETLQSVGVDNLETYRAVLRNTSTGETYDYRAVNIVGAVAAADLVRSDWSSHDADPRFDVNFDRLVVDESATRDLLLFRLAENTGVILIHERVRDHLAAVGFASLIFAEPKGWVT